MKPRFTIAITILAVLLISSGGLLVTRADVPSQMLSTTSIGGVTNLGSQVYIVNGGEVAYAAIAGMTLNPGATINYNLVETQNGFSTIGSANIDLTGTTTSGVSVSVSGSFKINDNVPGAVVGQGVLPFFFVTSTSNVQLTIGGSPQSLPKSLSIESPYFNPFGAPIVLASPDGAIVIAATYNQGTILWSGTQVAGQMLGTLDSTPTSGILSLTTGEIENLVTGVATDAGTTSFSSTTSSLNANGYYSGTSTIPASPTVDCSATTGIPGTCTETGFQSTGQFLAGGISGSYSSAWTVPALQFSTSISASVLPSVATSTVSGILGSSGSLCTSNGGIWLFPTCTIPLGTEWDIAPSTTLMIASGMTLVNNGILVNYGTVLNSGNIINNGVVTNDGVTFYNGNSRPTGTFMNNGIFTNDAGVTFNNFGSFTNSASGTINNYGTYQNHTGGSTYNYGTFFNYGTIDSHVDTFYIYGSFANMSSGSVSNSRGVTLTNECGGQTLNVSNNQYTQVAGCSP